MGRLTKKTIDGIRRLRAEGYTQKETAEKLDVSAKSVRKYEPPAMGGAEGGGRGAYEERLKTLEERMIIVGDLINMLDRSMAKPKLCFICPDDAELVDMGDYYRCPKCNAIVKWALW